MSDLPATPSEGPVGPSSSLRFDVVPYLPDGGCPPLGLLLTLLLVCLGGVAAGWLGSAMIGVLDLIPFLPDVLFLLLFAFVYVLLNAGVLVLGRVGIRFGKMRNPQVAGVLAILGVLAVVASTAYFEYSHYQETGWQDFGEFQVLAYIGYGVGAGMGGLAGYVGLRSAASMPFCTTCNVWKVNRLTHRFDLPPPRVARALRNGDVVVLADYDLSARPEGPLILHVAGCPGCGEEAPIDVRLQVVTRSPKGHKTVEELARVTYPGPALRVFESLVAPRERPRA
jgi:hypothetical protein